MAISAQVVRSDAYDVKKVEKKATLVLDSSGNGTAVIVNLDDTFLNDLTSAGVIMSMLVIPPKGSAGTYTAVYDSTTPKITIDATTDTAHASTTVRCILVAYDLP